MADNEKPPLVIVGDVTDYVQKEISLDLHYYDAHVAVPLGVYNFLLDVPDDGEPSTLNRIWTHNGLITFIIWEHREEAVGAETPGYALAEHLTAHYPKIPEQAVQQILSEIHSALIENLSWDPDSKDVYDAADAA